MVTAMGCCKDPGLCKTLLARAAAVREESKSRQERARTHYSYPLSPSSQSQITALQSPGCIPQPIICGIQMWDAFCVPSSSFASSWHWGNSNDTFASFFINQSQRFFVKEESPEADLINGMQHAPPHQGLFPPCLKSN